MITNKGSIVKQSGTDVEGFLIPLVIFFSMPTATAQKPRWNATVIEVKGCETVQSRGDINTFDW